MWSEEIDQFGNMVYGTGLAFEIPEGYVSCTVPKPCSPDPGQPSPRRGMPPSRMTWACGSLRKRRGPSSGLNPQPQPPRKMRPTVRKTRKVMLFFSYLSYLESVLKSSAAFSALLSEGSGGFVAQVTAVVICLEGSIRSESLLDSSHHSVPCSLD